MSQIVQQTAKARTTGSVHRLHTLRFRQPRCKSHEIAFRSHAINQLHKIVRKTRKQQ